MDELKMNYGEIITNITNSIVNILKPPDHKICIYENFINDIIVKLYVKSMIDNESITYKDFSNASKDILNICNYKLTDISTAIISMELINGYFKILMIRGEFKND